MKTLPLVRYISPYGSPAWMTREQAERYLKEDDRRWLDDQEAGNLSAHQREIGGPRIEVPR